MDIETLCSAVKGNLHLLKGARATDTKRINHDKVKEFQKAIEGSLNQFETGGCKWEIEQEHPGREEKDSVDILGQAPHKPKWIIEIDATRTDQVSQKLLSRLALWGKKDAIQYVAILYPDAHRKGQSACEKYLRYGKDILNKLNKKSRITGIFVFPEEEIIEVLQFNERSHFLVENKECKSMDAALAEVIRVYLSRNNVSYTKLKNHWGKYVEDNEASSRYKDLHIKTSDNTTVYVYTQLREHGERSYLEDFKRLCKKNDISITKMRKIFTGKDSGPIFEYRV